jgi:hypothetical protein
MAARVVNDRCVPPLGLYGTEAPARIGAGCGDTARADSAASSTLIW